MQLLYFQCNGWILFRGLRVFLSILNHTQMRMAFLETLKPQNSVRFNIKIRESLALKWQLSVRMGRWWFNLFLRALTLTSHEIQSQVLSPLMRRPQNTAWEKREISLIWITSHSQNITWTTDHQFTFYKHWHGHCWRTQETRKLHSSGKSPGRCPEVLINNKTKDADET